MFNGGFVCNRVTGSNRAFWYTNSPHINKFATFNRCVIIITFDLASRSGNLYSSEGGFVPGQGWGRMAKNFYWDTTTPLKKVIVTFSVKAWRNVKTLNYVYLIVYIIVVILILPRK